LIAFFVVDELVYEFLRQQNAEAARAHAGFLTIVDVAEQITLRIGYGCVGSLVQSKTFTRIADAALHHMTSADIGNLYLLVGVEKSTVFDRVYQHLTESSTNLASFRVRQFRDFVEELEHSIGCLKVAASAYTNPFRRC